MNLRFAAVAVLLSTAGLGAAPAASKAADAVPVGVAGQHATVMNNFYRAQQRNDAAIRHVQNNIRSTRPRTY